MHLLLEITYTCKVTLYEVLLYFWIDFIFQLQVQLQVDIKQPELDGTNNHIGEDDIDAALTDLQVSLEGSSISSPGDITRIPELQDYLRFFK